MRNDDGGESREHSATSAQLRASLKQWREIILADQFEARRLMTFALLSRRAHPSMYDFMHFSVSEVTSIISTPLFLKPWSRSPLANAQNMTVSRGYT